MPADGSSETINPEKPFRLSSYSDGTFRPDGSFTAEPILSPQAIGIWEADTKFAQGGVWGAGQALFFKEKPLTFGRDQWSVDVPIDMDPRSDGYIQRELGVSRKHFQLQPPKDGKVIIQDLGSTNGVDIYSAEGKRKDKLHLNTNHLEASLEVGDFTLFGGGGEDVPSQHSTQNPEGRLIGFRVCQDQTGAIFLVKFNVRDTDDLLSMKGLTRSDLPRELLGKLFPGEPNPLAERTPLSPEDEGILNAYQQLLGGVRNLRTIAADRNPEHPDVLKAYSKLFTDMFDLSGELGDKFYSGDWTTAAAKIGKMAMDEGQKLLNFGKNKEAAPVADLAMLTMDFATGKLMRFSQ